MGVEDRAAVQHLLALLCGRDITLENMRQQWVFISILRWIGDAAAMLGKHDEARADYEQNLALCEKIGFRPELAPTRAHLAELLLDHYPDEHDTAIEHLDIAIAESQEMRVQPALEPARERRGLTKA